jgi:hypothetical protein
MLLLINDIKLLKYVVEQYPDIDITNKQSEKYGYGDTETFSQNIIIESMKTNTEIGMYLLHTFKDTIDKHICYEIFESIFSYNSLPNYIQILDILVTYDIDVTCQISQGSSIIIKILSHCELSDELKMKYYTHPSFNISRLYISGCSTMPHDYTMKLYYDGFNRNSIIHAIVLLDNRLLIRFIRETGWKDIFEKIMTFGKYHLLSTYRHEVKRMIWLNWCIKNNVCRALELRVYKMI